MKTSHLIAILLVIFLGGAALYVATDMMLPGPKEDRGSGQPSVGGPFSLTNHLGQRVTEKSFAGKYMLVYFGYTFCPDVCPTELQLISEALDLLGKDADQVTPIFITVDPKRDNAEVMRDYVKVFNDRLVGLTGTEAEIKAAAKAYKVYYNPSKDGDAENYLMDHSSITFLMDRQGRYAAHFSYGSKPEVMAARIRKFLKAEKD